MSDDLFGQTAPDKRMVITELQRELAVRKNIYPHWTDTGRITATVAAHRIMCLQAAIVLLEEP